MAHCIVSYDLHNQRHYQPVWNALEALGATRVLESLWVVTVSIGAVDLCKRIKAAADSDDSVVVIELKSGSMWATDKAQPSGLAWLRQNIKA
jgi:hypothetical protein